MWKVYRSLIVFVKPSILRYFSCRRYRRTVILTWYPSTCHRCLLPSLIGLPPPPLARDWRLCAVVMLSRNCLSQCVAVHEPLYHMKGEAKKKRKRRALMPVKGGALTHFCETQKKHSPCGIDLIVYLQPLYCNSIKWAGASLIFQSLQVSCNMVL